MSLTQIVPTPLAVKPVYLVNPVSGEVVCTRSMQCAGVTLLSAFNAEPKARGWLGLNGQPFRRLDFATEAELRAIVGSVCNCEVTP